MAYRLVAVDVDGTLVDSEGRITEGTKRAVTRAVEKGVIFTICTGRPIRSAQPLVDELGLNVPFITYNGAMVVMGRSKDILFEQNLKTEDACEIYGLGVEYDTTICVWAKNRLHVNRLDGRAYDYGKQAMTEPELLKSPEKVFHDGVTKILWYDDVETIDRYSREVAERLDCDVNHHTSKPFFLEFVHKNASKAKALEKLGEYYGINRSDMIAIGDGHNDLSMIEYAGLGIAMANAGEEIKRVADYVTLSNDEDGVSHVIEKFIF